MAFPTGGASIEPGTPPRRTRREARARFESTSNRLHRLFPASRTNLGRILVANPRRNDGSTIQEGPPGPTPATGPTDPRGATGAARGGASARDRDEGGLRGGGCRPVRRRHEPRAERLRR